MLYAVEVPDLFGLALGDTEFLRPFPLDDSHTWRQCAFHNLGQKAFRKILLYETVCFDC